jgi:type II restriction enzyme
MTITDLIKIYENKKVQYGENAYKHISNLLAEAKEQHKVDFLQSDAAKKARKENREPDHEQSWRAFKGKNLEKLIEYIITDEIQSLGLKVINGNSLERTEGKNLPEELSKVKRNLLVDYGEYGCHLPDVDLVIYDPTNSKIIAVLSSKVTLRERIAQTGYWKVKLVADAITKHIKVYFITPDEDGTLTIKHPTKKGRAIVEIDTDGCYVFKPIKLGVFLGICFAFDPVFSKK